MGFVATLPIAERFFRNKHIYRSNSHFAAEQSQELVARLARGEAAYLAGISIGGFHNTGAALVEVTVVARPPRRRNSGRSEIVPRFAPSLEEIALPCDPSAVNGLECTANADARTDSASSCQECRTCTSITADPGFFFSNPRDETRHAGQRNPDPGGAIGDLIGDLVGGFFNQEQIE